MEQALDAVEPVLGNGNPVTAESIPLACPRCGGRLYKDKDFYGAFVSCLYCGFVKDEESAPLIESAGRRRRGPSREGVAL